MNGEVRVALCLSINNVDFTVSVRKLYGVIKFQGKKADDFMRHPVIVLTYSCYW